MNDLKAGRLARLERICLVGALAALFVGAAWKSGAGDGIIMGRYQATPPTLADGAPMDLLMGPRAELIVGSSASSSLRVQGTTEDGVAPLTSEDAPVFVAGRDPATGLLQALQTDSLGGLAITTSAAGAGAVAATTPRVTLASDDPAVASLSVLDDWDETNRAAVNPIAGQVGVQGGAGAATALTQRVSVATDDIVTVDGSAGAAIQQGGGAISAATVRTTQSTDDLVPLATTTDGGAASTRAMTVAGFDGANAQQLLTDATGAVRVDPTGTTAQPVTDAAGSLTVDAPIGTPVFVRPSDGVDAGLVTAAGELNVIATAQPGVDVGDVTVNNAAGAAAVNVQDGGNSLTVDGTITADSELPAATVMADNDGNPTTSRIGANLLAWDGATWDRVTNGNGVAATAMRVSLASDSTGQVALAAGTASIGSVGAIVNALPAGTNNIGDVDVLTVPAPLSTTGGGTEATALRVTLANDSSGQVSIEGTAGTAAQQGAGAATAGTLRITQSTDDAGVTSLATIDDLVRGEDSAHANLDSGVMMLHVASDAAVTLAGTDSDYAPALISRLGAHRVIEQPERYVDSLGAVYLVQTAFTTVTTAGAAEIQPVAAQGAGNSIVLLDWIVSTDTAANVQFESDDSDAGITARAFLAANGGWTSDHSAAWGETADNQALKLQVSSAATVSVQVRYIVR